MISDLKSALTECFGFSTFRPGQKELIEAVLAGRDALGVLPTGGGKSLTYQLPALLLPGLTVVVSPLIALMKDQVEAFNRRGRGIAVALHSNLSARESANALAQVHERKAVLFYVAPERLDFPSFRDRLFNLKPRLFVIDEAHCVSQWGYDFRPSYLSLKEIAEALRPSPVLALTATATPSTRKDVVAGLGLKAPLMVVTPFDRPNLRFEVRPCSTGEKRRLLRRILKEIAGSGSQIVYVGRRRDADEIAASLSDEGFGAVAYHAGMDAAARRSAQDAWLAGEKLIAVATVAFGMGIDKPDVRCVVHYQHPASLEAYYQEAGRGGRDGFPARCVMLFSGKDVALAHFFIRNRYPTRQQVFDLLRSVSARGASPEDLRRSTSDMSDEQFNVAFLALQEQRRIWRDEDGNLRREDRDPATLRFSLNAMYARKDADYQRLDSVVAYCKDSRCHRANLLRYFGEQVPRDYACGNCSTCAGATSSAGRASVEDDTLRIPRTRRRSLQAKRIHVPSRFARQPDPPTEQARSLVPRHPDEEPFWASKEHSFSIHELQQRKVARTVGLSVLGLVAEMEGMLPPSGIANVLVGSRSSDIVKSDPRLLESKYFGAHKGKKYGEILPDVLAMLAKGYLSPSSGKNKRLTLTPRGAAILAGK